MWSFYVVSMSSLAIEGFPDTEGPYRLSRAPRYIARAEYCVSSRARDQRTRVNFELITGKRTLSLNWRLQNVDNIAGERE